MSKQEIDERRHLEGNYRGRERRAQQEMEGEMVLTCCSATARGIDVQAFCIKITASPLRHIIYRQQRKTDTRPDALRSEKDKDDEEKEKRGRSKGKRKNAYTLTNPQG